MQICNLACDCAFIVGLISILACLQYEQHIFIVSCHPIRVVQAPPCVTFTCLDLAKTNAAAMYCSTPVTAEELSARFASEMSYMQTLLNWLVSLRNILEAISGNHMLLVLLPSSRSLLYPSHSNWHRSGDSHVMLCMCRALPDIQFYLFRALPFSCLRAPQISCSYVCRHTALTNRHG